MTSQRPMNRRRFWAYSCVAPGTHLYMEQVDGDCSDGMPRRETSLLATVYRDDRHDYYAEIEHPGESVFLSGFNNPFEAMTAVLNFLNHAPISTPKTSELL